MKKDTLYEIYSILKNDTTKITDSIYKLMLLNSGSEEIFFKFCKNNSVNNDTFDYFLNIYPANICPEHKADDPVRPL